MFKNRRNIYIFSGAGLVVIIAIILIIASVRAQAGTTATYQTTTVQQGTLTSQVQGTGTVRSALSANLTWQASGQVGAVDAQIGDQVKSGDVLASLMPSSSSISALQTALVNAQENLAELTSPAAIAAAQAAVASDEQTLTNAQMSVANLTYHNQSAISNAQAALTLAKENLDNAQHNYDSIGLPLDDPRKAQAYQLLYSAQLKYNSTVATYNNLTGNPSQATIDSAHATLALATANLAQDQAYLAALQGGTIAADATGTNLLKLEQAKLAVQTAQQNLAAANILAPFDGTITQSDVVANQVVNNGTQAFRIDDLSNMVVDISVVEIDVNGIKAGQPASIVFDAIPNKTYTGTVQKVDMSGTSSNTSVSFTVTVQITNADAEIKPGMGATVTITTNEVANALLVPSTSVFTDTNGQNYVYLIQNGTPTPVQVTIGAVSDTQDQILGNTLQAGDSIVLSFASSSTSSSNRSLGLGFGGLGGVNRVVNP
jgi:HlyD family secretion protein